MYHTQVSHTHSDDKTWFAGFLPLLCFLCDQKSHVVSLLRKLLTEQLRKASHAGKAVEHRFKHVHSGAEIDLFTDIGTCNNKFLHHVPNSDEILAKKAIGK